MIALVFVHLFVTHYASAPSATTSGFVGVRWAASGWRMFDGALLLLALTHGIAGVHGMLREVIRRSGPRRTLDAGAGVAAVTLLALGGTAIIAAPPGRAAAGPLSRYVWIPAGVTGSLVAVATITYAALALLAGALAVRVARREPLGRWALAGQWAFGLNRAAGTGILAFLLLHVVDVALFPWAPDLYDRTVRAYAMPYLVPMEAGLVAAVIYHAMDGLRLMTLEALDRRAPAFRAPSFAALLVVTVLLSLPALAVLLGWRLRW